jgi:hypothetical protein
MKASSMKEHLTNIRKARQYLVESRRALAATLAQYHDEGRSSPDKDAEYAAALASIQAGIAALDAAKEDEMQVPSRPA